MKEMHDEKRAAFAGLLLASTPEAQGFDPPEPVSCPFCGKAMYARGIVLGDRVRWIQRSEECDCAGFRDDRVQKQRTKSEAKVLRDRQLRDERLQRRTREVIADSGMKARFRSRTFETFEVTPENRTAYNVAVAYADHFDGKLPARSGDVGRNGLFIAGDVGVGKTHLAAAIANRLLADGRSVICMTMIDLLSRIRRTYRRHSDADEFDVLRLYETVSLLVIDDMGKEALKDWGVSTIYTIINARYEACMPTIVTTNYGDQALIDRLTPRDADSVTAEAIVDRLREMCGGVVMKGGSWRCVR